MSGYLSKLLITGMLSEGTRLHWKRAPKVSRQDPKKKRKRKQQKKSRRINRREK